MVSVSVRERCLIQASHCYCGGTICVCVCVCRVKTDHNLDDTAEMLHTWCTEAKKLYLSVDCHSSKETVFELRYPYTDSEDQYKHIASVQQQALEAGRRSGAQYYLVSL